MKSASGTPTLLHHGRLDKTLIIILEGVSDIEVHTSRYRRTIRASSSFTQHRRNTMYIT